MNSKIQLYVYKDDKKIEKLRLEEGEYLLGKSEDCDIKIEDEKLADKHLEIIVDEDKRIYIRHLSKKKTSILEEEEIEINKKVEVKDKNEVTFNKSKTKLKFRIKSVKESTPSVKLIEKSDHEVEEKYKHIKSEVVWNCIEFDKKNKKDKFLRLMGANKHKSKQGEVVEDKSLTEKLSQNFKKIENDLANQFDLSRRK